MFNLTRKYGLGVLLLVIVPFAAACYGIVTGQPLWAEQGKDIVFLIILGLAGMSLITYAAVNESTGMFSEQEESRKKEYSDVIPYNLYDPTRSLRKLNPAIYNLENC